MSKLQKIQHNKYFDYVLMASALMADGNEKRATQLLKAAVAQADRKLGMRILEANNAAAKAEADAKRVTASEDEYEDEVEVVDVGEIDLSADDLQDLVIGDDDEDESTEEVLEATEEEEEEHFEEDDAEEFTEDEVAAAVLALRRVKAAKAKTKVAATKRTRKASR